jgi:hypothetical protein
MQRKNLIILISLILLSIGLFLFIFTKSTVSSFTHDESLSYNMYVHKTFVDIISNKNTYTNNHLLNTICMKYSEKVFGTSELALRLPNLLMLIVFFAYIILFFRKSHPFVRITIFVLMFANSYLIDFFGLARGYGMSIAFMIMSLYHLIRSFDSKKNVHLILFNLAALFSILSSFTSLDYYVAALFIFNLISFIECRFITHEKFNFFKRNKVNIVLFLVIILVLFEPVRSFITLNPINFAGKKGFISNTLYSLISHTILNVSFSLNVMKLLEFIVILLVLFSVIVFGLNVWRANKEFLAKSKALIIVNLLLLTISVLTIIQHYLFKADYLVGRFALFLVPLFFLNVGFLYEYFLKIRYKVVLHSIAFLLAFLAATNFYANANFYSCAEWGFDMNTKKMIGDLEKAYISDTLNDRNTPHRISLGINWLFEPTVNFYRTTRNLKWFKEANRNDFKGNYDYYYIFTPDTTGLNLSKVINTYQNSNTILAK